MFIATLSGVTSNLPPACPIDITISGLCLTIFSSIFCNDFLKTVGISNFITSAPAIVSGSCLTASNAGFTDSPPNGSNPVIKTSGIYSLLVDQGSTKMRLDNTSENVYENELKGNILCGDVAKNGNTALATLSGDKLCNVTVYNKSLDKKMSYDFDYGYIIDIAINNSGSKIAFVALNSKNAQLKAKLYTMNVGTSEPKAILDLPNCNVLDLKYNSDNLYVVADDYIGIVSNQKKLKTVFECGKINTVCYTFTPNDELVLAYNDYSNSTENKLVRVRAGGNTKSETTVNGNIRYISASPSVVSVLTDSNIVTYSLGNMKQKKRVSVDDSVKSICQMGSAVFIHRQSLIERNESDK